jgi:hypothetical protein
MKLLKESKPSLRPGVPFETLYALPSRICKHLFHKPLLICVRRWSTLKPTANKNMFFKPTSNMFQHMFWHMHKGCFNFQTIMNRIRTVLDTLPISMSSKLLDLNRCSLFVVLCCQALCFLLNMFYKRCALLAGACSAFYCLTCLRDAFERCLRVPLDMLLEMCLWDSCNQIGKTLFLTMLANICNLFV